MLAGCIDLTSLNPVPDHHGADALAQDQRFIGAWLGSWPGDDNPVIANFSKEVGFTPDVIDVYLDWYTPFANVSHAVHHIAAHGAVPVLTWEAQTYTTQDILKGTRETPLRDGRRISLDAYLEEFAKGACAAAQEDDQIILLRVLHEMNGDWFAWGLGYKAKDGSHPNSPESYKAAWRKIHDAFTDRCGDRIRFVWAVNHFSKGDGVAFTNSYPGDDVVDYAAIDGYNWGTSASWGWQSFDTLFKGPYCAVSAATQKPMFLAEVASSERGGNKSAWIRDLYHALDTYPRLRGFVWLNDAKYEIEIKGNMDWPIDSSPASLDTYRDGAQAILDARARGDGQPAADRPC